MLLVDTHCHLHDQAFFTPEDAEEALKRARENGVEKIVCIGTSHEDSLEARDFAEQHENVFWTYGIHPENASRRDLDKLLLGHTQGRSAELTVLEGTSPKSLKHSAEPTVLEGASPKSQNKLVGIGEVGLDYHYDGYDREAQIQLFNEMLQLAKDNNLPLSFHIREAFDDFFAVVKNFPEVRGVVHSFTDSKKNLKRILNETNFYVGVNGLATYSTLPTPPLDRILLETDAPFLAPVPFRGERNDPSHIYEIAKWLSEKLGEDFDTVVATTTKNALDLYGLDS